MIPVKSISVQPKNISLKVGTWCYSVSAECLPEDADNKEVVWHSDNMDVATVNPSNGYIYAKAIGYAKIYAVATDGSGCSDYLTVTVGKTVPVDSVELSDTAIALEEGSNYQLSASVSSTDSTNNSVTWKSSDANVATVDNGIVSGVGKGTAKITATATDGTVATCSVTVTQDVLVTSVCISPSVRTMFTGKSAYFYATVCPEAATDRRVVWSSSNSAVATVNPTSGLVYAKQPGRTVISAMALDDSGCIGMCELTVKDPVYAEDIQLNRGNVVLYKGERLRLIAKFLPDDTSNKSVRWSSRNENIASVNEYTGVITARSAGTTKIYATAQDGSNVQKYCNILVKQTVNDSAEETPVNTNDNNKVADPVDVYTGAHLLDNTIMYLFGGQGIKLVAHYDSTQLACGLLGFGWHHNFEKHIEIKDCEAFVYNNPSIFSRYTADSDCCTRFTCCSANKNGYVLTVDHSRQYPYIIDCNSARTEYYNSNGDLAKIVDHQGFVTTLSYSASLITITDCVSGKKMYLEKDSTCKVIRVYDDAGREALLSYTNNLLTSIKDVNENSLMYTYDSEKRVISGTDSKGIRYFENTYDDYGRVLTQKDALNHTSYFDYSENAYECCEGDTRITTNRNGKKSYRIYDCNGLLIKYTDENGNVTTYVYDDRYNVIKETDGKGNSVVKTYNSFNKPTQVTDRNGNKTYFTYDAKGNVTKIRYPAINGVIPEETFVYNSRNQMTQHTDIRGTVTLYTYDTNGMPATKKVGSKNAIVFSYQGGLLKSQTDAMGNTTVYAHNAIGQVISKTDAENKVTQYTYDNSGNLLTVTDANGKTLVNTYDGNYQKTSVTDANGNKTEYSYNGNMKNDVITLPDGHTIRYEFDGEDRTVKVIDQLSNATNVTYDDAGRVLSKRLPDGALVQYEYDKVGNVVKETNPKGAVVTKTYDKLGNVLTVTDDEGNVTSYEYNAMNKVTKMTNAVAGSTVYVYSKSGDLLSETDALGNTKTYTYDAFGNRLTATDAKNNVTTYTYDQNNNLLTVKDALNHVTTYTYNALNQCVSVKDALNNVIRYGYDALGRRTTITDARGNVFTTTYDGNGNVIKTNDAKGNTISETVYNSLNQPLTVTDAMGKVTTYTYNEIGKVESVTDSMNHRTEFTYNSRGQNTNVRDAANNNSTASYDLLGNVTRLAGPLGGATNYTYDDMGRLVSESTVSGGTKSYEYNELNVRKKITNARGQVRQVFYDAMGRITGYNSPEGSVSYTYDANGNVLTVVDSHGTITRTYDALNRVSSYTDTYGKVIRYEYDAVGNLSKIIYPDNTAVTYAYDANHNLIRVTDWANRVTAYTYDVNNRVVGVTKPDGSVTTTAYDNKQRVTSTVERTAGGAVITGFEYTYDDLSRIVEEKHLDKNSKFCYTYDNLNRVISRVIKNISDNSVISTETFTYDAAGNVTDAPDSCFQYDTNNRLVVFNGNSVSYDLDGNMLNNGVKNFTYDSANRLITADGHTYTYNAEDVRIRNLCSTEDTTYTYDTNCRLSKLLTKTTGGVVTKYVYGRGLIGEEVSNAFKTYHFDCRGSTIAITDASGNITDTFAYDTYGKLLSRTGTSAAIFGYNGRDGVVTDANGLIYMRARYYSPEMKRFINADIVAGEISNAITLNRFAYANGNPVSFVDPFGLSPERGSVPVYIDSVFPYYSNPFYSLPVEKRISILEAFDEMQSIYDEYALYRKYGYHIYRIGGRAYVIGGKKAGKASTYRKSYYDIAKISKNANVDDYWNILKNIDVPTGLQAEFSLVKPSGKINGGAVLNYVGVALDVGLGIADNIEAGTRPQKIVSDAIVDTKIEIGIIATSTAIGSAVGSAVPIAGNIAGAAAGFVAGLAIDWAVNKDIVNGKSLVDLAKDGAAVIADEVVEMAQAAGDFFEEAGEVLDDFFENAENTIGGFLSGLFG